MSRISAYASLNNAVENSEELAFAKSVLSKNQFMRLYKSYKNLFWAQMMPFIILAAIVVLELIFIPSETAPNGYASTKETIILFEVVFFIVPIYPVWLIVTQFCLGKLWHKYTRWYKRQSNMDDLYRMF